MRRRLVAACVAALLGTSALTACGGAHDGAPDYGTLPDVTLQPLRSTDQAVSIGELKGPTVINLWAQWCGDCKPELPKIEAFHRKHADVQVLGVDWFETLPDRARALAAKDDLTYPIVTDPDKKFGGRGLPQLILVDARGRVAYRQYGPVTSVAQLEKLVRTHLKVDL